MLCSDEPIPDWPRQLQQATLGTKQAAKGKLPAKAAGEDPDVVIKDEDVMDTDIQVGHLIAGASLPACKMLSNQTA